MLDYCDSSQELLADWPTLQGVKMLDTHAAKMKELTMAADPFYQ